MSELTCFENGVIWILANEQHIAGYSKSTREWDITELTLDKVEIETNPGDKIVHITDRVYIWNQQCTLKVDWSGNSEYSLVLRKQRKYDDAGYLYIPFKFTVNSDVKVKYSGEVRFKDYTYITDDPHIQVRGTGYETMTDADISGFVKDGDDSVSTFSSTISYKSGSSGSLYTMIYFNRDDIREALKAGKLVEMKFRVEKV